MDVDRVGALGFGWIAKERCCGRGAQGGVFFSRG